MNTTSSRIVMCGLLFAGTLISGVWLSNSGKPLNTAIFTVHKLTALATIIAVTMSIFKLSKSVNVQTFALLAAGFTGLFFLALFVSGALLSIQESAPQTALRIHQVAPPLALITASTALYLLVSNRS